MSSQGIPYLSPLNLGQQALNNAVIQNSLTAPSSPVAGQVYYNTTSNQFNIYSGSAWQGMGTVTSVGLTGTAGVLSVTSTGTATAPAYTLGLTGFINQIANLSGGGLLVGLSGTTASQVSIVSGAGITVTNGTGTGGGTITVAANQDISTSASPTFVAVNITESQTAGTTGTHAATLNYVNTLMNGLSWKDPVSAATAGALSPTNTYASGVLTATANGILTVDGVATLLGMRILVANEATAANNGVYVVTQAGTASVPYILTRTSDFNTWAEIMQAVVPVNAGGTNNANTTWLCNVAGGGSIGTTTISFVEMPTPMATLAGAGLFKNGNTLAIGSPTNVGYLTVAQGGTGSIASLPSGGLMYASSTNTIVATNSPTTHGVLLGGSSTGPYWTAVGTNGQVLTGNTGADPTWQTLSASNIGAGTLSYLYGGTGSNSALSSGGIIYAGASNNMLCTNTVTQWGIIVGNTVANSGPTWTAAGSIGQVLMGAGAALPVWTSLTGSTANMVLTYNGTSTQPTWSAISASNITTGTLAVANGGTGATTAAGAKTNLGFVTKFNSTLPTTAANTQITMAHGLGNANLHVFFYNMTTSPYQAVDIDYSVDLTNIYVTLNFAVTVNTYSVVAFG